MPALSRDLEMTLKRALLIAEEKGHGRASPAHLTLALLDDIEAKALLRGCDVDVPALTSGLHRLSDAADGQPPTRRASAKPDPAFEGVIRRAVIHAQAAGREHVGGALVMVTILRDAEHEVACRLRDAGMTRYDATRFVSHGIRFVSHGIRKGRDVAIDDGSPRDPREEMRVTLLNDDYTPMKFVVEVLRNEFDKGEDEAARLMLEIHQRGFAQCGAYPRETAAAKVAAVAKLARDQQHPLHCVMEPIRGLADALLFTKPRTIVASGPGDRQRA